MNLTKILLVGIGGFIGAALRYIISLLSTKLFGSTFPFGTLAVNVVGGLLMGFIMGLGADQSGIPPNVRLFLTTGILGGFTTFSTFSYETVSFLSEGAYLAGGLNAVLNLFFSLGGVVAGKALSGLLH